MLPPGSEDALALKFTVRGGEPDDGVRVNDAVGGVFTGGAVTVTVEVAVPGAPLLSVTVSVAV